MKRSAIRNAKCRFPLRSTRATLAALETRVEEDMLSEKWVTSVDELVQTFRAALIALIPIADRAHMPWREPNNYDDWDSIAAAIYKSIVLRSLEESLEWSGFDPIQKYDKRADRYSNSSFLTTKDDPGACALVCLETKSSPFDTCLLARLNGSNVVGLERRGIESVSFVLAGRSGDAVTIVDTLRVLL